MIWQLIKNVFSKNNLRNKHPEKMSCPFCNRKFHYKAYSGMSNLFPHFYCNQCSNVIRRLIDFEKVMDNGASENLLQDITSTLPECSCGGSFQPGTNPKCPHCRKEIAHQDNAVERLTDPYLIVVQGAKADIEV